MTLKSLRPPLPIADARWEDGGSVVEEIPTMGGVD